MRPLPPHWPDYIPGLPILFVFVGAPDAYEHARQAQEQGFYNHTVLSCAEDAHRYQWPTYNLMVIVILFEHNTDDVEQALVAEFLADEPKQLAVRYWPDDTTVEIVP